MNSEAPVRSAQGSAFWDVFVLKEDGRWLGIRAPWASLRRVVTLLTILFATSAVGLTGWLLSRWQSGRLERLLSLERLKSQSLEDQLVHLRSQIPASPDAAKSIESSMSILPALGGEDLASGDVSAEGSQVGYDPVARELHMSFELVRKGPRQGPTRFYWLLLVHGPQGVLSYPPALASRSGEAVEFHRGQAVDDVRIRRSVSTRFKAGDFFEGVSTEPVFATLLLYDSKGSLLSRKRHEIAYQRAAPAGREGR